MTHRSELLALALLFTTGPGVLLSAGEPRLRATIPVDELVILAVAYSPDGKVLASGGGRSGPDVYPIRLWDTATNKELAAMKGHGSPIISMQFGPDGRALVSAAAEHDVRLWDVAAGKELFVLKGHRSPAEAVAFSPDGKTVASGGIDKTVRTWDVATGKELARIDNGSICVSYTPDGKTLAYTTHPGVIKLWDVATGKERAVLKSEMRAHHFTISPDGKALAVAFLHSYPSGEWDDTIRLWDFQGKELSVISGPGAGVRTAAFRPDGRILASTSLDHTVRLWDVGTGQLLAAIKGKNDSVAFSPDGKTLATGGRDKAIKLWDISAVKAVGK